MNATQNRDLFNSDNNPTTSSIKRAISSNHHVQSEVINRLAKISQRKIENREMAHDCWLAMERLWIKKHEISTPKMLNEAFSREFYSSYQKHHASLMKATPDRCKDDESVMLEKEALRRAQVQNGGLESDDKEASCERNNEKSAVSRSPSKRKLISRKEIDKRWMYDEGRKWKLRYFVDPDATIPKPNVETNQRREMEGNAPTHENEGVWTKSEENALCKAAKNLRQRVLQRTDESTTSESQSKVIADIDLDYSKIASLVSQEMSQQQQCRHRSHELVKKRSALECQIRYMSSTSPSINRTKWSKSESLQILEIAHQNNSHPAWDSVAQYLGTNRTPWQCFRYYQTALNPKLKSRAWTVSDDELLLKYVTGMGPGYILNLTTASKLCRNLFLDRSPKQVYLRGNLSLANPNLVNEPWSNEDERKLVMCMKAYKDDPSPMTKTGHHFPQRSNKSVWDKWHRSLNPEFSQRPWTKKEDEELLSTVELEASGRWSEISSHFPSRNPKCLFSRWVYLTNDCNLIQKQTNVIKIRGGAQPGVVRDGGLLSPEDFVVRIKTRDYFKGDSNEVQQPAGKRKKSSGTA